MASSAQEAPRIADVDEYLSRAAAFGFSGGVAVMHKGELVLERGYGMGDRAKREPITPATLFDVGSITKTYTAMAIHRLIDQGKLSLDDTLGKFFPDAPDDKKGITISQMMTHTAGLPLYSGDDYVLSTREEMVRQTLGDKLTSPPGTKWAYSNTAYQLLTVMIEDLTGKPYEQHIHEQFLKPAGITHTGYVIPNFLDQPVAQGYQGATADGSPLQKTWYGDGPSWNLRGAGGFLAPLREVAIWARTVEKASPGAKKRAWETLIPTGRTNEQMGHGWFVRTTPWGGRQFGHSGGNGYFGMNLRRFVDHDLIYVFATNNADYNWGHESEAAMRLFGAGKKGMPPRAAAPVDPKLAGRYRLAEAVDFDLRFEEGQLVVDPAQSHELIQVLATPKTALTTPEARALEAKAVAVYTSIAAGDVEPLLASLPPSVDKERERKFWSSWSERVQKEQGKFVSVRPLWVVESNAQGGASSDTEMQVFLRVRFEKATRLVQYVQRKDGQVAGNPPLQYPELFRFVALSPTELATWNPYSGETRTVKVEKDALVIGAVRAVRRP
jgi:CubicO group peptidase (beta-lactamase class C family)